MTTFFNIRYVVSEDLELRKTNNGNHHCQEDTHGVGITVFRELKRLFSYKLVHEGTRWVVRTPDVNNWIKAKHWKELMVVMIATVQSCWQQAWPFDFPENLKFCRTIHTRGFYEGIINISHSSDVEDDRLTNWSGQQNNDDGHQSPMFIPNQEMFWLMTCPDFNTKVQIPR